MDFKGGQADLFRKGDRGRDTGKVPEMAEDGFQRGSFTKISNLRSQI
jgi:hypothetical protein